MQTRISLGPQTGPQTPKSASASTVDPVRAARIRMESKGAKPLVESYSIRRPEMALLMTSCWISLVPSKIVWLTLTGFVSDAQCCHVPPTWAFRDSCVR